ISLFYSKCVDPSYSYTLSLHDALPIWSPRTAASSRPRNSSQFTERRGSTARARRSRIAASANEALTRGSFFAICWDTIASETTRSEEHTSELQSPDQIVCRLLLEKKKK